MGLFTLLSLVVMTTVLLEASANEYKFQTIATTWYHAEELCKSWGGHLVTISSQKENAHLRHQMEVRNMKEAWIGLNDRNHEGIFEWVTNPAHLYINWMKGEPNGGIFENCGQMHVISIFFKQWNGEWNDANCNSKMAFVCEKSRGSNSDYKYFTSERTWSDARSSCHSWGGYLVIVNSRAENELLVKELRKRNMKGSWIGLTDKNREGMFDWVDNHRPLGYINFQKNEPNGVRHENCVETVRGVTILFTKYDGHWIDKHCDTKLQSICEKARCTGQDNGCCTKDTPCDIGEGDCDSDSHCAGDLVCGHNNCPWGDHDDCCVPAK